MRVKFSYDRLWCHLGVAGLASISLSACSNMDSPMTIWKEITGERDPQVVDGPRRKPMLNKDFEPTKPQAKRDEGYFIPTEEKMAKKEEMAKQVVADITSHPGGPINGMEPLIEDTAEITEHTEAAMAQLAPAANYIPSPMERKPIASNPDAHRPSTRQIGSLLPAQNAQTNAEYPPLSSVPVTPGQFETVRAEHPSVKQELLQSKQASDTSRKQLNQHIADEAGEGFMQSKKATPTQPTAPVVLEKVTEPAPLPTPVTASVDKALVPPPAVAEAPPLQAAPTTAEQPTVAAVMPANLFVSEVPTQHTAQPTPSYVPETNAYEPAYEPVVPQYRYAPIRRERHSGYLPDSRY